MKDLKNETLSIWYLILTVFVVLLIVTFIFYNVYETHKKNIKFKSMCENKDMIGHSWEYIGNEIYYSCIDKSNKLNLFRYEGED